VTPAEFTAAVREMAALGSVTVRDWPATENKPAYRYASLTASWEDWRERIVGLVELAQRIDGYVTIDRGAARPWISLAISRDLTPDEIAALPDSSRDVPLDDVIGEVA
jgi:hypothetical protein